MSPRISKSTADKLIKGGAKVREEGYVPKPAPTAAPETDLTALTGAIGKLVQSLQEQLIVAQQQLGAVEASNSELRSMVAAISTKNPVRLKPVRDMDRGSPTYLLTQHIDMIPVTHRKLDS